MKLQLIIKSLRDRARSTLWWALSVLGISAMMLSVYPSIKTTGKEMDAFIKAMPEFLVKAMRIEDYTSGPGYLGAELFSMMIPIVFVAIAASAAASASAEEEERGTSDLIYSLPVARWRIVLSKLFAGWIDLTLIAVILFACLRLGAGFAELEIDTEPLLAVIVACYMLAICFASFATLIGVLIGRRAAALGAAIGIAILSFLIYTLAPMVDTFDNVLPFVPYDWAFGEDPIRHGFDWPGLGWLAVASAVLNLASLVVISRRDIRA